MGKLRLYHPVSLHVIRGAAEYCGWKFGKITQLYSDVEKSTARYEVKIEVMPDYMEEQSMMFMQNELQQCFMDDIRVHWLHQTKAGIWMCHLAVDLSRQKARSEPSQPVRNAH
jgi:hypothetical protein